MNLFVLDKELDVIAIVDTYTSFIWTDRYQEAGDFELCMPMDQILLSYIKRDHYLWRNDSEHVMIIESIKIESDSEDGDRAIITGRSLESILDRRVIWGLKNLSGDFQDAVKTLLEECIISPSKPERKIANFKFEATDDTRITDLSIDTQYTGDNLYDVICALCKERNIGFKVTLNDSKQFVFSLYSGDDRSYDQFQNPYVVFSPNFDNIIDSTYQESSEGLKNVTLVGGEGEGIERRYTAVGNTAGLSRRELFTDARDISSDDDTDMKESFVFTQYPNQVFNNTSKTFVTDNNFNSCMVDVSAFAGNTIRISIPKYNNASGVTSGYATILVNASKGYISTLKAWEKYDDDTTVVSRGSLETFEIQLPIDAQYIYTSMYSQTAIDADVYYGEIDDFECQSVKISNAGYITLLRQRGSEDLSENVETISFEGQAETTQMFKYGTDFFMGDVVNVADDYGHDLKVRILELITSENEDGSTSTYPTFASMDYEPEKPSVLPDGYTELTYIQSSGTQYIDTGIKPNQNTRVIIDLKILDTQTSEGHICSVSESSYYSLLFDPTDEKWYQTRYGSSILQMFPATLNSRDRVLIDKNKRYTTIGTTVIDSGFYEFQLNNTLPLLCHKSSSGALSLFLSAQIYSCMIYDGDTLVRNFIPARFEEEESLGLYDTVNGQFYLNAGTGSFTTGDVEPGLLPDGYTQKEYIQSSGTQYIDTLFKPNQNTRVVCDFELLESGKAYGVFGARIGYGNTSYDLFAFGMNAETSFQDDYGTSNNAHTNSQTNILYHADKNKNVTSLGNVSYTFSMSTFQLNYTMYLFGVNTSGSPNNQLGSLRIYSCKIYDNGTLIRDFVPCINPSGTVGLYDVAGKAFYANAGTGTFTAG